MKKCILATLSFMLIFFTVMPGLQPHAVKANAKYAAGEYDLPFTILKDTSDEPSMTNDYMKSPAKLIVEENGDMHVVLTLNNSSWWQYLKVQTAQPGSFQDSNFADAAVISEDKASDTRVVKFKVQNIEKVLNAKIHVLVPMINYDNKYDIRFQFDASGIPLAPEPKPQPEPEIIADGEYTIGFRALHAEEDKDSAMGRYMVNPATLSVNNGKKQIQFVLKDNQAITGFQVEKDGKYVDAAVISVDEEANTRTVAFDVERLDSIISSKVQVHVPAQNYTGNHVVRLSFDKGSMQVKPKEDPNEETPGGEQPGEKPGEETPGEQPGEKPGEETPGEQPGEKPGEETPGEQPGEKPSEEKPGVQNPDTEKIDPRDLKDGEYSIDYSVLKKDSDELSMMDEYVVKPGSLKVKDGKKYLAVTLKKSSWITDFKVEKDGNLVAPKLLQSDEKGDTRTIEFEVADVSSLLNAWVKVDIPELNYHNEYDIRFSFDTDSIILLKAGTYPKEDDSATLPPKPNDQKPKANDKNDRLDFDRNGDKPGKSTDQTQLKADHKGVNPKTADTTKMLWFALLFVLSLVPLVAKLRSQRHVE